jgi:F1F0 ATPase subunit 2
MNAASGVLELLVPLGSGVVLGLLYFGGLWITTRRLPRWKAPAAPLVGSFLLRSALCVAGFVLVSDGSAGRAGLCLVGFLVGRGLWIRRARCDETSSSGLGPPELRSR